MVSVPESKMLPKVEKLGGAYLNFIDVLSLPWNGQKRLIIICGRTIGVIHICHEICLLLYKVVPDKEQVNIKAFHVYGSLWVLSALPPVYMFWLKVICGFGGKGKVVFGEFKV